MHEVVLQKIFLNLYILIAVLLELNCLFFVYMCQIRLYVKIILYYTWVLGACSREWVEALCYKLGHGVQDLMR